MKEDVFLIDSTVIYNTVIFFILNIIIVVYHLDILLLYAGLAVIAVYL